MRSRSYWVFLPIVVCFRTLGMLSLDKSEVVELKIAQSLSPFPQSQSHDTTDAVWINARVKSDTELPLM